MKQYYTLLLKVNSFEIELQNLSNSNSMKQLIKSIKSIMLIFESLRFELPWRWNKWSSVYQSAFQQIENMQKDYSKESKEYNKKTITKLESRKEQCIQQE